MTAAVTIQTDGILVLRALRQIRHSSQHISDITVGLSTLTRLRAGAIDGVLVSIGQIANALKELESQACQQELLMCRQAESRVK